MNTQLPKLINTIASINQSIGPTHSSFVSNNRVFAKKIIQPIIPSNLKKAKFIRASL